MSNSWLDDLWKGFARTSGGLRNIGDMRRVYKKDPLLLCSLLLTRECTGMTSRLRKKDESRLSDFTYERVIYRLARMRDINIHKKYNSFLG